MNSMNIAGISGLISLVVLAFCFGYLIKDAEWIMQLAGLIGIVAFTILWYYVLFGTPQSPPPESKPPQNMYS